VQELEQQAYESKLEKLNILAEQDSVRQIADDRYARLSKQFIDLNEVASEEIDRVHKLVNRKDAELQSLAKINAELSVSIDTLKAEFREDLNRFHFMRKTEDYYIVGTVSVDSLAPVAYVFIDSLTIPVKIDVMFIRYTDDETVELQVAANSKFIEIKNLESFIKVPPRPKVDMPNWGYMAGPMFGKSYGVIGGIRYKKITVVGQMLTDNWGMGVLWNF
jgi:hypothetical protein